MNILEQVLNQIKPTDWILYPKSTEAKVAGAIAVQCANDLLGSNLFNSTKDDQL